MVLSILISVVSNIQPACTYAQFDAALSEAVRDEQSIIASVIFDQYLEQFQALTAKEPNERVAPIELLETRFNLATQADTLFDELLASLSVLDSKSDWKLCIMNLRRTVLLQARQVNNPWPATVWVDAPRLLETSDKELIQVTNTFLLNNIDNDRQDRFEALRARLVGDIDKCKSIELKAMARWGTYQELVEPYILDQLQLAMYPLLDDGQRIHELTNWITANITDTATLKAVQNHFTVWNTLHNKHNSDVISLIKRARLEYGFDPWSRGCGQPNRSVASMIKNKLLQRSAEIQELHRSTLNALMQLLTEEQRQLFDNSR